MNRSEVFQDGVEWRALVYILYNEFICFKAAKEENPKK
jgi:hypothetical protein